MSVENKIDGVVMTGEMNEEDMCQKFSDVFARLINDTNDPEVNMLRAELDNRLSAIKQEYERKVLEVTDRLDRLEAGLANIQLTPGPVGPKGDDGADGAP